MNKLKTLIITISLFSPLQYAHSFPTIYPRKPNLIKELNLPKDVTVISDNADDNKFYMLPPANAFGYATNFSTANANLGFCDDMIKIQEATHVYVNEMHELAKKISALQPYENEALKEYLEAAANAEKYAKSNEITATLADIDNRLTSNQERLNTLYEKKRSCTTDCRQINGEINIILNDIFTLRQKRNKLVAQNQNEEKEYTRLTSYAKQKRVALSEKHALIEEMNTRIIKLTKTINELYRFFAEMEGGAANLFYDSEWEQKLLEVQRMNPEKTIVKIDVHNVKMNASLVPYTYADATYQAQIPAILDYVVAGKRGADVIKLKEFPSTFSARIRLSLAGACAITRPEAFKIQGIEPGKIKLGLTTNYTYDSAFNTKINCEYNEKQIYDKLLTQGSSGALWWKRDWQRLDINMIRNTGFSCTWNQEQLQQLSFFERRKFEIYAFNYVMSKMLQNYGTPQEIDVNWISKPNSGLNEVAQGLDDLCGSEIIYCKAGAWLLKSLDAIFGGGESSANAHKTFSSTQTLNWDDTNHQRVSGMTGFTVK